MKGGDGLHMAESGQKRPSITVFFPVYNDEGTVESMIRKSYEVLSEITDDFEIIAVNDGSQDRSGEIAERVAREVPHVRVIHHPQNRGYGAALRTGFTNATKEWVFYTDGDAQYDVAELRHFVEYIDRADVINGYKIKRADHWSRWLFGKVYYWIARFLFNIRLRDVDCDFRLMRRSIFDHVTLHYDSGVVCVEMMKKIQDSGYRIIELPVKHYPRRYGVSQFFRPRRILQVARDLLKLRWDLWRHPVRRAPLEALRALEKRPQIPDYGP